MYRRNLLEALREQRHDKIPFGRSGKLYGSSTHFIATFLVLLACLGVTIYYWQIIRGTTRQNFSVSSEKAITEIEPAIGDRIEAYANIMTGASGLVQASDNVTREEWSSFIEAYNINERYPGVQGFGYGPYVPPAELADHIQSVRNSDIPEYSVTYTGNDEPYVPIQYISPFSDARRTVLGFNMMSEPTRKNALILARDTGKLAFTGKVALIQSKDGDSTNQDPGMIMYLPVYEQGVATNTESERRNAIIGFVYSTMSVNELLKGIFGDGGNNNVALQVYDGEERNEDTLLYRSDNFASIQEHGDAKQIDRYLDLGTHKVTMSYLVSPHILSTAERNDPWFNLGRGILISLGVAVFVYYLLTHRTRKLVRAQQQEVQSAKDDLLSLASHQLRTPATVVKQYVGMLLQGYGGKLTAQQQSMLNSAYVSNERQLQIINQILYVARLDAGQLKIHRERFDVAKLARDLANVYTPIIKDAGQKIVRKIPRKAVYIKGDAQYLFMAIDNLISNATKYTPRGGTIFVCLDESSDHVEIKIEDTGAGIGKKEEQFIFDKFTRGQGELMGEVSGSGIGLYLVKQIAELHHGSVNVKANKPKGSIFILRLPKNGGRII